MLVDWGARKPDNSGYVHRECGSSIPRQAGKSTDGIVWALFRSVAEGARVLWTDHNYSTTCEMLNRFRRILGTKVNDPNAMYPEFNRLLSGTSSKTAQEAFFLKRGGGIHFSTRTKSAALGYSFDMIVYDEAQELTNEQQQAILPTMASGHLHDMQSIYLGTPPRPGGFGDIFAMKRDQVLEGSARGMCWWEWGVGEIGDIHDEERWRSVNPSIGGIADIEAIRTASNSMTELSFAQDYLGYWLPKAGRAIPAISEDEWHACRVGSAPSGDPTAFGIKFSSDGRVVCLAAAIACEGGTYVELVTRSLTAHGIAKLVRFVDEWSGMEVPFMVDGKGGTQTLLSRCASAEADGLLVKATTPDAIGSADAFLTAVREGEVMHLESPDGDDELTHSATTSPRRAIGSHGGWGFGGEDPTAVEAAALAMWMARRVRNEEVAGEELEVFF